jgi:hypothetical protein
LNKEEVHRFWAPPEAVWSRWVKPVLFAFADSALETPAAQSQRLQTAARVQPDWLPSSGSYALIVDLPGEEGVLYGLELARRGYRPIPLYNALPFPLNEKLTPPQARSRTTVEVTPILAAICRETVTLEQIRLSPAAPPAFLLDADRRIARIDPEPGVFDNRSVSFETDFPSADFLLAHAIGSVIVLQKEPDIAGDLAQTLLSWQRSGVSIFLKRFGNVTSPRSVVVQQPSFLRRMWYRISVALSLRRGELGAFGSIVPSAG